MLSAKEFTIKKNNIPSVFTALFAALICSGSIVAIPVGPVPIVLQNAFAILAGLLLGPFRGAGAVALFLIAGSLGLPVFSGGHGGFMVLMGPTGGYLVGYLFGAIAAGFADRRASITDAGKAFPVVVCATIAGFACIYIPGIFILKMTLGLSFKGAVAKGFLPFLVADTIKMAALVPITLKLRPIVARYLDRDA